ncbi:MAG: DNA polymerase III subunit beta [Sumerlaeia bacterium]
MALSPQGFSFAFALPELRHAIGFAESLVAKVSQTLPILKCVILESIPDTGEVLIKASTMDDSFSCRIKAQSPPKGSAALPAAKLRSILASLPDGRDVVIESDATTPANAKIVSGRSRFKLLGMPAEDMPSQAPLGNRVLGFTLPGNQLDDWLSDVLYARPASDHRRVLLGVNLDTGLGDGRRVMLTATDGKRLARSYRQKDQLNVPADVHRKATLPPAFSDNVAKIARMANTENVTLELYERRAVISYGAWSLTGSLLEGKYPDCDQVIPREFSASITFDAGGLESVVKQAVTLANDTNQSVIMNFEPGATAVSITSMSADVGAFEGSCDFQSNDPVEALEVAMNVKFLLESLRRVRANGSEALTMRIQSNTSPILLVESDERVERIIMPIKLAEAKGAADVSSGEEAA